MSYNLGNYASQTVKCQTNPLQNIQNPLHHGYKTMEFINFGKYLGNTKTINLFFKKMYQ